MRIKSVCMVMGHFKAANEVTYPGPLISDAGLVISRELHVLELSASSLLDAS